MRVLDNWHLVGLNEEKKKNRKFKKNSDYRIHIVQNTHSIEYTFTQTFCICTSTWATVKNNMADN